MEPPEKINERLPRTLARTGLTTTVITLALTISHVSLNHSVTAPAWPGTLWVMLFCIVFGGHWLELLFINRLKWLRPLPNLFSLYTLRFIYWYLSAVPLYLLAELTGTLMTGHRLRFGNPWIFGLIYIALELFMQALIHLRLKKSFYNGVY